MNKILLILKGRMATISRMSKYQFYKLMKDKFLTTWVILSHYWDLLEDRSTALEFYRYVYERLSHDSFKNVMNKNVIIKKFGAIENMLKKEYLTKNCGELEIKDCGDVEKTKEDIRDKAIKYFSYEIKSKYRTQKTIDILKELEDYQNFNFFESMGRLEISIFASLNVQLCMEAEIFCNNYGFLDKNILNQFIKLYNENEEKFEKIRKGLKHVIEIYRFSIKKIMI